MAKNQLEFKKISNHYLKFHKLIGRWQNGPAPLPWWLIFLIPGRVGGNPSIVSSASYDFIEYF